jgi:anthranilate synthase/aminodeoxychorismate synthase-like glutamine amidotransferase
MVLVIDNYDSFTYNLVQLLEYLKQEVKVYRNDRIDVPSMKALRPAALVISPGPCSPAEAGVSVEAIRHFGGAVPVLGVCLGHQAIAAAYGGRVVRAERVMHGKTSIIFHDGRSMYGAVPNPFEAVRYHSLIVEKHSLPQCLEVTAWTDEGEIMGIRHRHHLVEGVQFHPESILTREGTRIVQSFLQRGGIES